MLWVMENRTRSGTALPALWFGQPDPNNQETRRNAALPSAMALLPTYRTCLAAVHVPCSSPSAPLHTLHPGTSPRQVCPCPSSLYSASSAASFTPTSVPTAAGVGWECTHCQASRQGFCLAALHSAEPAVQERACTTARSYP
jgi:hypothetical protein